MKNEENSSITVTDVGAFDFGQSDTVLGVIEIESDIATDRLKLNVDRYASVRSYSDRLGLVTCLMVHLNKIGRFSLPPLSLSLPEVEENSSHGFTFTRSVMVAKDIELRGEIVAWDKLKEIVKIQTPDSIVTFKLPKTASLDSVKYSFDHYKKDWLRKKNLVIVKGKAVVALDGKICEFKPESLEKLRFIDPVYRVQELRLDKRNWEGMEVESPYIDGLLWLESFFRDSFPSNLRPPYLFLNDEGNVRVEWQMDGVEMDFGGEINLGTHILSGLWFSIVDDDNEEEIRIDLDNAKETEKLWSLIKVYGEDFDAR